MYDIIYDYLLDLFSSTNNSGYSLSIMGVNTSLAVWLAHTGTIIVLILLLVFMGFAVRWCFRLFNTLLKW